jgi:hypothetical protein
MKNAASLAFEVAYKLQLNEVKYRTGCGIASLLLGEAKADEAWLHLSMPEDAFDDEFISAIHLNKCVGKL